MVAFDFAQYFPSLNHEILIELLDRQGFTPQIVDFFSNYLVDRQTQYAWDNGLSPMFLSSVGVGQGSALFPILLALYLMLVLWRFYEKQAHATLMSYVDDGTIIIQSPLVEGNLTKLKRAYKSVFELTSAMGLKLKHNKLEAFHFSRSGGPNPPVDLGYAPFTGDTLLVSKKYWRYLEFFFDRALTFKHHISQYVRKALSTMRSLPALGNSVRGLKPDHKRLYRSCILPIVTYEARLWNFKDARNKGALEHLWKMQQQACL